MDIDAENADHRFMMEPVEDQINDEFNFIGNEIENEYNWEEINMDT